MEFYNNETKKNETKNEEEETTNEGNLLNVNNDVFESVYTSQNEEMIQLKKNLNKEQEKARILQQRANEQKRYEETISSHQAKLNALTNNNNNNDDETMSALQANYQIEEKNRKEERELNKLIE